MEVFIAYTERTPPQTLVETMTDWDTGEFEPVAILVKDLKNENLIRIAAEAIAKSDYMVAKLGTDPTSKKGVSRYKKGQGIRVEACQPRIQ